MRDIEITEECLEFIDAQSKRVSLKFFQLIEVISEVKIVNSNFVKKLQSTQFYELRINAGNEYRVIILLLIILISMNARKQYVLLDFKRNQPKIIGK